ncbi:exopolysaccharide biosynthesis GT4 family glycosyltransferase EpsE [Leptolyngbya ohadii]|uniref:exopolysaccharide biosynthesis GT4 family glycosyltransferase EpsE n=1 Tax=Leptolyngbya ohadii TaxID=1962290 RepID=UPI000B5A156C|nr:exopolysaccharide biosynthesis GT4 family glycosyltransferase EpsE [Leptolyngbya ohadii]
MPEIGYFIPEFPGQTHIFFWRERQILSEFDITTDIISTRRPPRAIASHAWANEAEDLTTYLSPLTKKDLLLSLQEVIKAGPAKWFYCLKLILNSDGTSLKQKLQLFALLIASGKLVRLARETGWSHIHVHSCANSANVAMFASIIGNISYSMTLHGPVLSEYGPNQRQKWKHASFGFAVSQKLYEALKEQIGRDLPPVEVIPMGVDLNKIKRRSEYIPWKQGEICNIFACGRLNLIKGHNYLLQAVKMLRERGINAHLKIAGEDEQGGTGYHQYLDQLIRELNLSDCVQLLGAVSEEKVREGLENAHVFALASLNEGIPVAVMEAMAMAMPVVVTDVGGNAELIDDGVDGILIQPENPVQLADTIEKVVCNEALARSLSQKSREKIVAKFSSTRSAKILADYLDKTHVS